MKRGFDRLRKMSASEIATDYQAGRRDFHYVDLAGEDLSSCQLSAASFYGSRMESVNLRNAFLTYIQFKGANLRNANLSGAALNATDLIAADFTGANLSNADLTGASLARATLIGANLTSANLCSADLGNAELRSAQLGGVRLYNTVLCDLNVSPFCDEAKIEHGAPSYIDHRTLIKSQDHPRLRDFMIDCGIPPLFTEFMMDCARALDKDLIRELMQSTFISYGGPDERFARKLYEDLRRRGVVTFFFPQTATIGERIGDEVYRGIQQHDRILLICSQNSLKRAGVVNEIQETLDREARDGGATYLLPITVDDYVFNGWDAEQPILAERVKRRVVGDFREAHRDTTKLDSAVDRLVQALKKKRP